MKYILTFHFYVLYLIDLISLQIKPKYCTHNVAVAIVFIDVSNKFIITELDKISNLREILDPTFFLNVSVIQIIQIFYK